MRRRHHLDVAVVVDEPLPELAVPVGGVEHREVLIFHPRCVFDRLSTTDHIVGLTNVIVGETELMEHREPEPVVLLGGKAEALHRLLAEGPLIEGEPELEDRGQCVLDLADVLCGEALGHQRRRVDVR